MVAGWHSPAYGVKLDAPIVSVPAAGVADHDYHTLVVPLAGDDARAPTLRVIAAPDPDATLLQVAHGDGRRERRRRVVVGLAHDVLVTRAVVEGEIGRLQEPAQLLGRDRSDRDVDHGGSLPKARRAHRVGGRA